jgi:nitrogenase molybdenum-iron protein alpha/beta subunit
LTAEISRATFGMTPSEYKELKKENLRDHMTNLELIFTMLGEEGTKAKAIEENAQGFVENKKVAIEAGTSAGNALKTFEKDLGIKVITADNYKAQIETAKQNLLDNHKEE